METDLPMLSVGTQSFEEVRLHKMVYIDKTGHFPGLRRMGKTVFLSRPRRFGKSLTVSALYEFHSGRTELFDGLAAHGHMVSRSFVPRPVILLNMIEAAGRSSVENLARALNQIVEDNALRLGVEISGDDPAECFMSLLRNVFRRFGIKSVVLVDEYDAPVISLVQSKNMARKELMLDDTRELMSTFYAQVKAADTAIDFTFITGVTKFSRMGVFSQLNNVTDISLHEEYGDLVGFTQEEIETNFSPYLSRMANRIGMSTPELLARVRDWYDGFSFDGIVKLYNPFSFVSFLNFGRFSNFWMESGSSSFIREFFRERKVSPEQFQDKPVTIGFLMEPGEIDDTTPEGFLYQAGYLSVLMASPGKYMLHYPNAEVRSAVAKLFLHNFRNKVDVENSVDDLTGHLTSGNLPDIIRCVYRFFAGVPYPTDQDPNTRKEDFYRSVLYAFFSGSGSMVSSEQHTSHGRSDIVVRRGSLTLVIEVKTSEDTPSSLAAAEQGFEQILSRRYGDRYVDPVTIAIAFALDIRNIGSCIFREKGGAKTCLHNTGQGLLEPADACSEPDGPPDSKT
jgi:AraC-like DNA-binding protein